MSHLEAQRAEGRLCVGDAEKGLDESTTPGFHVPTPESARVGGDGGGGHAPGVGHGKTRHHQE